MKRFYCLLMCVLMLSPLARMEQGQAEAAQQLMDLLSRQQYEALFDQSSKPMQEALASAKGYQQIWEAFELQYGSFESLAVGESVSQEEYQVFRVDCYFERARLTLGVALDQQNLLSGLFVQNVEEAGIMQEDLQEGEEELLLRPQEPDETVGLLQLPPGEGPFPAVVLIHGSGGSDRDESVFGMKPFSDLAKGLAAQGIASLRYDKYTYAHGAKMSQEQARRLTMQEEYLNDALAAAALLAKDRRIGRVYLLGHSQGAQAAIRAAAQLPAGSLSGLVLLCGTPNSMADLYLRQVRDALDLPGVDPAQREAALLNLAREQERMASLATMPEEDLIMEVFFNAFSGWYLKDERSVDYQQLLDELQLPLLIIQGGKDWQVKREEGLLAWQALLGDSPDVAYKEYADMTHLLFDLQQASTGTAKDYAPPQPVSDQLIADIANWVRGR